MNVVHLPKRTKTRLITESDQIRANHQLCTVRTAWSDSDQAVWAVHSCESWFLNLFDLLKYPVMFDDFNTHIKVLIAKLLRQGYRYHKIRKALSNYIGGSLT